MIKSKSMAASEKNAFETALAASNEYGLVEEARSPLVLVSGLPSVKIDELIIFENNEYGYVVSLGRDLVECLTLSAARISLGSRVTRTDKVITVPVGEGLRGQVIDPLGRPLTQAASAYTSERRRIDITPPHIGQREQVTKDLATGTSLVDLLLPLGRGQRQAVLGDQKTGKTTFLLSAMRTFAENGLVVFAAIGKPVSAIAHIQTFIEESSQTDNIILVASQASDVPSLVVLTPFTAMTVAEYFRDRGQDVLVIFDDLTSHAQFYREIALLGRRFPGRESYPGDIFHLHARLLERAGNFKLLPPRKDGAADETGEGKRGTERLVNSKYEGRVTGDGAAVDTQATNALEVQSLDKTPVREIDHSPGVEPKTVSITCLAVAETVRSDLTGYIVSNLISITDGHFLFDASRFNQGQRPAIDESLSVTRVGLQTQPRLAKKLNRELIRLLARYARAANFAHFGTELSGEVAAIIDAGSKLKAFFSQPPYLAVPLPVQLIMAGMIWQGFITGEDDIATGQWRDRLVQQYVGSPPARQLIDELTSVEELPAFVRRLNLHKEELVSLCHSETILSAKSA
ncbi:MAG: hypothetical protein COT71_02705 [Candidatus Andersenbacteria bacterium CG10_big_fil_rev_8_21_14_0_10_54_11]|uniref:ATPase F1/V1/A1 complex alpha/beta subunit nucleotide-binding domain-containing protein n=1 Tax=Candidatus Andersenbacteria bacterium CG10_big_fil_rev_8_21_14_0_10_54_11 TaxID=1974485 RepID=A0A2M6WZ66_9BACT|nr:MAG: hypothetical protein COT71_02705 [Candidatus Andersenbacteria bacterium CG10_big_fil_rev_8_21_14_0_10_54_11]